MKRTWLLLVLLAAVVPAAAADMYSWTDANGVKHFSDSPPPGGVTKAQKLKVKGGVTSTADETVAQTDPGAKGSGPALAAAAGYSPDDIKRNCDIANKNLATLEAQHIPAAADGSADTAGEKSRSDQIEKANQQIKLFCTKH